MNFGTQIKTLLVGAMIAALPLSTASASVRASSALPTASAAPLAGAQVAGEENSFDGSMPILPLIGIAIAIGVAIWIILDDDDDVAVSRA